MAEVPSASAATASSPSLPLYRECLSRRQSSLCTGKPPMCSSSLWCSFLGAAAPNPLCFWTSMDIFWIARLTILILLHQTSLYEVSCVIDETTKVAAAGASDTTNVTNSLDEFMCLCINNTKENATHWYRDVGENLVVVEHDECYYYQTKFQSCVNVYKDSNMLCICMSVTVDGGTYHVRSDGKTSTFEVEKSMKLKDLTSTCKAQNCSHESCKCGLTSSSALAKLKRLNCMTPNSVKSESITVTTPRVVTTPGIVTTPGVLCNGNTTVPSSPGTSSMGGIAAGVAVVVSLGLLLLALCLFCKYGVPWMRRRFWINGGSQDDSHGAAEDMDTQAESFL
ncbi:uncharacterized protein LOC141725486 isoform X5 [Zonotrichia albicollis]|uniref:uncharacterized protein LOC141725486 isoform X5 n=1 Tax=Zonotrichia albicollis TaxID=44394 RepID=UPI003D80D877